MLGLSITDIPSIAGGMKAPPWQKVVNDEATIPIGTPPGDCCYLSKGKFRAMGLMQKEKTNWKLLSQRTPKETWRTEDSSEEDASGLGDV